jgi:hypothetical protein
MGESGIVITGELELNYTLKISSQPTTVISQVPARLDGIVMQQQAASSDDGNHALLRIDWD